MKNIKFSESKLFQYLNQSIYSYNKDYLSDNLIANTINESNLKRFIIYRNTLRWKITLSYEKY